MMPRAGQAGNPNAFYEDTQAQLEQAKLRAAQTAHALKNAPQASYPTTQAPAALAQPAQRPAAPPAAPSAAPAPAGAAQAPAKPQPTREQIAAGAGRLKAASDTPNVDAVLGVNRRAIERSGKGLDGVRSEAQQAEQRRKALRDKLRMSAFAMSNPGASPLEADMYRRGGG